jgi:hypothetical protein
MDYQITLEDALYESQGLWMWLSVHPNKLKSEWPGWANYKGQNILNNLCPLCNYTNYQCEECPMFYNWNIDKGRAGSCILPSSLYFAWTKESSLEERALLAKLILLRIKAVTLALAH